ncbi:hypothetical protein EDD18DRAFT_1381094 [Armillaria luteobubalina]|uniref:C2H2-type domain-containing protein n=1 Tax=Armillaria luteobubalina TaxID=153913 RepID=A0AA39UC80_9AGAR|nr:hypothetical protein EDD18DRAFT_1381094 [Armillaria luteobubalina]
MAKSLTTPYVQVLLPRTKIMPHCTSPILPPIATLAESDFSDSDTESYPSIPSSPLSSDFMSGFLNRKDRFSDDDYDQLEDRSNIQHSGRYKYHDDGRDFKPGVRFDARETDRFSGARATPIAQVVLPEHKIDRRDAAPIQRDVTDRTIGGTRHSNWNLNSSGDSYMFVSNGVETTDRGIIGNREDTTTKEYRFRHYDVKAASSDDAARWYAPGMQTEPATNIPLQIGSQINPVAERGDGHSPTSRLASDASNPTATSTSKLLTMGEFGARDSVRCAWPDCNWTSNMVGNAKRHFLVIKHKEKGYVCDECSEMYTRKDALKRHRLRKHVAQTDEEAALDGMMMLLRHSEDEY